MKHLKTLWPTLAILLIGLLVAFSPAGSAIRASLLCATEAGNCVEGWNGVDLALFSDEGSTSTFNVEGSVGAVRVAAPAAIGTATPAVVIDCAGASNCFEVRDAGTPVFSVADGGGVTSANTLDSGSLNNVVVAQPTAATTATPAVIIDSLAAGANLLEVRDATTPVFTINNGGAWSSIGAGTHSGAQTVNSNIVVSAPTAVATAVPAAVVNSAGVSNLLEVRKASTPVFTVGNGGAVTGLVFQAAAAGQKCIMGTQVITGAAAVTHGLSTPTAAQFTLAEDVSGDGAMVSYVNSAAVITASIWTSAATPVAASAGHTVSYWICGTP
jgi:hypothetical protein